MRNFISLECTVRSLLVNGFFPRSRPGLCIGHLQTSLGAAALSLLCPADYVKVFWYAFRSADSLFGAVRCVGDTLDALRMLNALVARRLFSVNFLDLLQPCLQLGPGGPRGQSVSATGYVQSWTPWDSEGSTRKPS